MNALHPAHISRLSVLEPFNDVPLKEVRAPHLEDLYDQQREAQHKAHFDSEQAPMLKECAYPKPTIYARMERQVEAPCERLRVTWCSASRRLAHEGLDR